MPQRDGCFSALPPLRGKVSKDFSLFHLVYRCFVLMQLQCHRCVAVQQSQGFHSKFIISPKTMFVNDEDFAFVVVCFSILASLTSARAKRCMPKKRKADCVRTSQKCSGRFLGGGRIFSAKQVAGYFSKGRRTFL